MLKFLVIFLDIRHVFAICVLLTFALVWGSFTFYQWIFAGTGNANFFYNATLVFVVCNLYLLCSSIAALRRYYEFVLKKKTTENQMKCDDSEQVDNVVANATE